MSISLHWLMVVQIAAVYACIELSDFFPKGSAPRAELKEWHFMLGLSVLAAGSLRLVTNLLSPRPQTSADPRHWQERLARWMQWALYALMLGLPLVGWLLLSAAGKPIPFFGLQLTPLIAENKALVDLVKEVHETGANAAYVLIGLHAAAALVHHYLLGDNTLRRMLPGLR